MIRQTIFIADLVESEGDPLKSALKEQTARIKAAYDDLSTTYQSSKGDNDIPLYVGKSIGLRSRVISHFNGDRRVAKDMRISQDLPNPLAKESDEEKVIAKRDSARRDSAKVIQAGAPAGQSQGHPGDDLFRLERTRDRLHAGRFRLPAQTGHPGRSAGKGGTLVPCSAFDAGSAERIACRYFKISVGVKPFGL